MPVISATDEKLVILKKVNNADGEVASIIVAGDYTVDWGDGTTGNYDSGKQADHTYTYSSISSPVLSDGSKQVLITITPQSGKSLTSVNLQVRNPAYSEPYESGYLEIVGRLPNVTALQVGYDLASYSKLVPTRLLTSVSIADTKQLTTAERLFHGCSSLKYAYLDTTAATSMCGMFAGCRSIQTIPLFNSVAVKDISSMFNNCLSIQTIPPLNTANATNMDWMFSGAPLLQAIPLLNTANVTSMVGTFNCCPRLQSIPPLNTANVTNMNWMFHECPSLQAIPPLNTANVTSMSDMFGRCYSLLTIPALNTAAVKDMSWMFDWCFSLQSIPPLNMSAISNMDGMFNVCGALQSIGIAPSISFNIGKCSLSSNALNALYNALPKVSNSQTLTITGNPGANNSNTKIATDKGWTITN
jgi:hypothetical protein